MNILIFTRSTSTLNQFRPEAEIYCNMAKLGHTVTILTDPIKEQEDSFNAAGVKVIKNKVKKKICLDSIKQIRKELAQNTYDIVYACCSKTIPNAAIACLGFNVKLIAYRGTTGGLYKTDLTNYLSLLNPRINGVICVSNAVQQHVQNKVRKSIKENVKTIYKGHDLSWYEDPTINITELGSTKESFNILCIGSNREHKGMQYLLEAASYLKDIADLKIILVGNSFSCEPFISQIKATGMSERILQPGFRADVPQIAKACDLLILPSIREGLPRAILESLANGTPVITSANAGAMEIIEDNVNGFIVPIADGKAIAEKVRLLYQHRDILERFSTEGINTIKNKMSHQNTVINMINYFENIISQQ